MTKYTKLATDGSDLPDDATDHLAVRVEHPLLAKPLIVAAYRCTKGKANEFPHKEVAKTAASHEAYGWQWRAPTAEEAFLIPDRSVYPSLPKLYFPDAEEYEGTWTSTVDAEDPSGFAWFVVLVDGGSGRVLQSGHGFVRAVCASQS